MKTINVIAFYLLFTVSLVTQAQQADIIITNGKISTLDDQNPEVQAVAISGNKILQTGSNKQMLLLKGEKTIVVDAQKRRVIPGLFDSHMHVIRAGRFYNMELRWDGVTSLKRALQMLKEQAARTPEGQWIRVVGGWNEYQFEEKRLPSIEEINEATGDVPTFILYLYGSAWLNKAGLKKLNINSDTPNPAEGLIQKDEQGNPTGLLIAEPNAFILYSTLAKLPTLTKDEEVNSTIQFMTEMNRLGVTGVMDAGGGFQNFPDDYSITNALSEQGKITIRLPHFLFAQKKGTEYEDFARWIGMVELHAERPKNKVDYYVSGGGENIVSDAADFENFLFPRPELSPIMEVQLKRVIKILVNNRWPFRLHATYNESINRFLNVIEEVDEETPLEGLVWFFDHAETISEENLQRIKKLGGGIAIQHRMAYQGESFIKRYGKKQALTSPPIKRMLELDIPVGLGTDGTRVASYNPWVALYWITTGKTVGGNQVMANANTIDRTTALRLATHKGYELIQESNKGKIKKDFFADIIILDDDFFTTSDENIKKISSKLTIVDGRVVYGDNDYKNVSPPPIEIVPAWSPVKYFGGYQQN
ncbi:amidohydrolase [Sphingobacterium bambusae]|uniref:Amidohydrolase n=1 Tax=Sphingobacterium bambusae TaxID=662858 RepID=A0ABW6BDC3_9SPHI|nr:amidohydrolase [Sphingobacterium bambusae]WPL48812.1 amidohydrolase [Sphingobacterium bambusae]